MARTVLIIYGATGDLTQRKLLPSLHSMHVKKQLPAGFTIIAIGRRDITTAAFRAAAAKAVKQHTKRFDKSFLTRIDYHRLQFEAHEGYDALEMKLKVLGKGKVPRTIHYLATSPRFFGTIVKELQEHKLTDHEAWTRVVFEKPFGHDLASARRLNKDIAKVFEEEDVYRVDHYLGKEAVQNILVTRFANTFFEPLWNRRYIDHIQITVSEELGVGSRGPSYYEKSGALRDMVQSHVLQLLMFIAMEPPGELSAAAIQQEKVKALRSIEKLTPATVKKHVIRGQYAAGTIDKKRVPGYRQEAGIHKKSMTETFVAMKLKIKNWRWQGVPIYLRTGKRLAEKKGRIVIQFKSDYDMLFPSIIEQNLLTINFQPDQHIGLHFNAKKSGKRLDTEPVVMDFCQSCRYEANTPDSYEELFQAVIEGDRTLFTSWDEVENEWKVIEPILKAWQQDTKLHPYKSGSWGPKAAEELMTEKGRKWL